MKADLELDNQAADEEVIMTVRQHPWVLARAIFNIILVILIVFAGILIGHWNAFTIGLLAVGVCFVLIYVTIVWYSYSNDLLILTNHRIIKIDQKSFFNRRVSETELDNVMNINYEIKGLIKSLLNFGDVKISTVGDEVSMIVVENVENPHFLQEKIATLAKKYKN
ncbi:MAG: PH domain-containing protein [Candidatus Berkelbacteria bacterium]